MRKPRRLSDVIVQRRTMVAGAVLVLGADLAAQRLVPGTPLPVGVMTGALGGLYLVLLLTRERRGRAS